MTVSVAQFLIPEQLTAVIPDANVVVKNVVLETLYVAVSFHCVVMQELYVVEMDVVPLEPFAVVRLDAVIQIKTAAQTEAAVMQGSVVVAVIVVKLDFRNNMSSCNDISVRHFLLL